MTSSITRRRFAAFILVLAVGLPACSGTRTPLVSPPSASPLQERGLDANLFMQTSAEYEAICRQTYRWATERLRAKVVAEGTAGLPLAVVMDLDETVLDNGGYQSFLIREGVSYTSAYWEVWERDFASESRLVPGAKEFIEAAAGWGVSAVFISNRQAALKNASIAALGQVGLSVDDIDRRLMLMNGDSDKTGRRREAESRFRVLMYVGDNLRDFSEEFAAPKDYPNGPADRVRALAGRREQVRRTFAHWGDDWIILPNPAYGEWLKPLGADPKAFLTKTEMKKK